MTEPTKQPRPGVPVPSEGLAEELLFKINLGDDHAAACAFAAWGADEQLWRCIAYLEDRCLDGVAEDMVRALRPPTGSLKRQAVSELLDIMQLAKNHGFTLYTKTIRRALEALPDD
jgi:hypothetical protein